MPTLDRRASFRAGSIATGFQILRLAPPVRVTALNAMYEAVFCFSNLSSRVAAGLRLTEDDRSAQPCQ